MRLRGPANATSREISGNGMEMGKRDSYTGVAMTWHPTNTGPDAYMYTGRARLDAVRIPDRFPSLPPSPSFPTFPPRALPSHAPNLNLPSIPFNRRRLVVFAPPPPPFPSFIPSSSPLSLPPHVSKAALPRTISAVRIAQPGDWRIYASDPPCTTEIDKQDAQTYCAFDRTHVPPHTTASYSTTSAKSCSSARPGSTAPPSGAVVEFSNFVHRLILGRLWAFIGSWRWPWVVVVRTTTFCFRIQIRILLIASTFYSLLLAHYLSLLIRTSPAYDQSNLSPCLSFHLPLSADDWGTGIAHLALCAPRSTSVDAPNLNFVRHAKASLGDSIDVFPLVASADGRAFVSNCQTELPRVSHTTHHSGFLANVSSRHGELRIPPTFKSSDAKYTHDALPDSGEHTHMPM
ncbi:hypothetical protein DFH06DRAFT_1484676 [Mycena polygramma]|nr:hypothetical protein DFH06DRAFT_1484676 [Mycena polygramma]